jgi:hypothetical protein
MLTGTIDVGISLAKSSRGSPYPSKRNSRTDFFTQIFVPNNPIAAFRNTFSASYLASLNEKAAVYTMQTKILKID